MFKSVAPKTYRAGDIIFQSNPVIHSIKSQYKGKVCDNCLNKSDSLEKCSKCVQMYYCSKECQQIDWTHHKNECKIFRHQNFKFGSLTESLLLRLWLSIRNVPNFATKTYRTFIGTDISLNDFKIDPKSIFTNQRLYGLFIQITANFDNYGLFYTRKELLQWFGLVAPNGPTFDLKYCPDDLTKAKDSPYEWYNEVIGRGVFIQMPSPTHSCIPNSCVITNGLKLEYRAIKPIGLGKEFTTSFVELGANKEFRGQMLANLCSNKCECHKCLNNSDEDIDYNKYNELLTNNKNFWNLLREPEKAIHEITEYLMDQNLFLYMKAIFGEYHPQFSEALVLSYICFSMFSKKSDKTLRKLWYTEIEPYIRVTHGKTHPIYKLMERAHQRNLSFIHK